MWNGLKSISNAFGLSWDLYNPVYLNRRMCTSCPNSYHSVGVLRKPVMDNFSLSKAFAIAFKISKWRFDWIGTSVQTGTNWSIKPQNTSGTFHSSVWWSTSVIDWERTMRERLVRLGNQALLTEKSNFRVSQTLFCESSDRTIPLFNGFSTLWVERSQRLSKWALNPFRRFRIRSLR
jgi:hypothetical protein